MKSAVIILDRPMAATRMSARRHSSAKPVVFEWQIVTVAFSCSNSSAIGLPTISLRPTTTACFPAIGIRYRFSISIIPDGVHGRRPGLFAIRLPALQG